MTSIRAMGDVVAGYADAMNLHAAKLANPEIISDPLRLGQWTMDFQNLQQGYQLTARVIGSLHQEDQVVAELLRDA